MGRFSGDGKILKETETTKNTIEKLRLRLHDLAVSRGTLNDGEVLAASQKLDDIINHYLRLCQSQDNNK